jgi:hypothetical protein
MKKIMLAIALTGLMVGATAHAEPKVPSKFTVKPTPVTVPPQTLPTGCRWVRDNSGIPDPSRPMLVLSCLPKP